VIVDLEGDRFTHDGRIDLVALQAAHDDGRSVHESLTG
jgi:hypothetical protein